MCSFGSCQTRFEFLSQFRKVWNAFECFVTQVQTHLPKTKRVWPMKINVICTVCGCPSVVVVVVNFSLKIFISHKLFDNFFFSLAWSFIRKVPMYCTNVDFVERSEWLNLVHFPLRGNFLKNCSITFSLFCHEASQGGCWWTAKRWIRFDWITLKVKVRKVQKGQILLFCYFLPIFSKTVW